MRSARWTFADNLLLLHMKDDPMHSSPRFARLAKHKREATMHGLYHEGLLDRFPYPAIRLNQGQVVNDQTSGGQGG